MRNRLMTKMGLGVVLATMTVSAAVPAEAQRRDGWNQRDRGDWNRGRRHGDGRAAGAVLGGVLALGIGAAIASSINNDNRRRDYEARLREQDYYQDQGQYGAPPSGYDPYYPRR